ncbi:MAG: histidine phosphatase family protein [Deltaproteobacteria bacterium]|nr:histidine phosphatase family protein [Deltaproteobacteria bacterium]
MPTIYLIRHGRAAAGWGESVDPGLDGTGKKQAAGILKTLGEMQPMPIVSSPMARARETAEPLAKTWNCIPVIDSRFTETAEPLAKTWNCIPVIDSRFTEIPTPANIPSSRKAWIKAVLSKNWDELSGELQAWRENLILAACSLPVDTVVFTHFIAINALVGKAVRDNNVLVFLPDNTSITSLTVNGTSLMLLGKGRDAAVTVG